MKVKLAGFNVDLENIKILKEKLAKQELSKDDIDVLKKLQWTPETISASYARISRDSRPIDELRKEAGIEVDKARKSNKTIIFQMGHSSIAEHANFNFDIINISRLLAEELEKSRLASFTEKSQRYIKIGKDILYPDEFKKDLDFFKKYKHLVNELFESYEKIHNKILPYFLDKNPGIKENSRKYIDIINLAKEDARYILPLSTLTQVGMTVNARALEKIIRKLSASPLEESKKLAENLFTVVDGYSPSLVKYTSATEFETKTYNIIYKEFSENDFETPKINDVELISYDTNIEENFFTSLLVKLSDMDYKSAMKKVKEWNKDKKGKIFKKSIELINSFDPVLREYEISDFIFNILISATAYAQLKRHRMCTIIDGSYSPKLDVKIPESILECGQKEYFLDKINKINNLYYEAKNKWGKSADYILSNAHRKNVILKCNFRELVHISRLRSDIHAQWDIRNISNIMTSLVSQKSVLFSKILGGKDSFESIKENIKKM